MTKEEIIRMARMAGIDSVQQYDSDTSPIVLLERFASLVAEQEREQCAKVCDEMAVENGDCGATLSASAIRSRVKI
jgi:hypothetical protein